MQPGLQVLAQHAAVEAARSDVQRLEARERDVREVLQVGQTGLETALVVLHTVKWMMGLQLQHCLRRRMSYAQAPSRQSSYRPWRHSQAKAVRWYALLWSSKASCNT